MLPKPLATALALLIILGPCFAQRSTRFLAPPTYPVGGGWVVTADFNNDGLPDMAVGTGAPSLVTVLLNNGNGTFAAVPTTFSSAAGPLGSAIGLAADLNGDGNIDLVLVQQYGSRVAVLLGNGDGTFGSETDYSVGSQLIWGAFGDFNGDGKLDLALGDSTGPLWIMLGNGNGTFGTATQAAPYTELAQADHFVVGDFNGDGKQDIVALGFGGGAFGSIELLLGKGDGTFQAPITVASLLGYDPKWIVAADFNRDGKLDLAVSELNGVDVFLNDGAGQFSPYTRWNSGTSAGPLAVADLNGDGNPDLVETNLGTNSISVLLGSGKGSFQVLNSEASVGGTPGFLAPADLNRDGRMDIAVAAFYPPSESFTAVLFGLGDGTFQTTKDYASGDQNMGIVGADFDKDGKMDLAVVNYDLAQVTLLRGAGDGSFAINNSVDVGQGPYAIDVGDINGDGNPDLVIANQLDGTVSVLLGNGFNFTVSQTLTVGSNPYSLKLGDLNGDGKLDLVVSNRYSNTVSVFLGKGNGTFNTATTITGLSGPEALALADLNGDGKLDLVVVEYASNDIAVFLGNGDGTFGPPARVEVGSFPEALGIADFNGDGKPDLVVTNDNGGGVVTILPGNGDGTFGTGTGVNIGGEPVAITIGDVNGDGHPDLAVVDNLNSKVFLLAGNGDGTFQTPLALSTGLFPEAVAILDINGDGVPDIVSANGGDHSLLNSATISPRINLEGAAVSGSTAVASSGLTITAKVAPTVKAVTQVMPTGVVAIKAGSAILGTGRLNSSGQASILLDSLPQGTQAVTAIYAGDKSFVPSSASISVASDFKLMADNTALTVSPGQTASTPLQIAPINGSTATVSLSCSGAPAASTCSISPSSVTLNGNSSANALLSVATTASTAGPLSTAPPTSGGRLGYLAAFFLTALAILGNRSLRPRYRTVTGLALLLVATGCGGGGSSSPQAGTAPGTYQLTISATSGTTTHSTAVTLTVQ